MFFSFDLGALTWSNKKNHNFLHIIQTQVPKLAPLTDCKISSQNFSLPAMVTKMILTVEILSLHILFTNFKSQDNFQPYCL